MKRIFITGLAVAMAIGLASCTTTDETAAAAKTFDTICAAEPPVYAAFEAYAAVKDVKASIVQKAAAGHEVVTTLCTDRPTNIVTALSSLSAAWIRILGAAAEAKT